MVVPTLALTAFGFAAAVSDPTLSAPASILAALSQANISATAALIVGLILPLVLVAVIGVTMFWKRPTDPMVLLTSLAVITDLAAFSKSPFAAMSAVPELEGLVRAIFFLGFGSMVLLFALFPNGRSVPARAWMAAPVAATIAAALPEFPRALALLPDRPTDFDRASWTIHLMFLFVVSTVVVAWQVYRYRKWSNHIERLQAKWVILPLTVSFAQLTLVFVLAQPVFRLSDAAIGWVQLTVAPVALLFPVGLAAAILRYRLYDIERIVSRTVSFGSLTVFLFFLYAALVFLLRRLTPVHGDFAVAVSTLGVAAVANPLRRRIQQAVDERFNRTHADASRTLNDFTESLRIATDLRTIADELQGAVTRTFRPDRLGVWVRPARP
ncbi:MAG TPA: hypothetical protein VJ796_08565 [Acidimicrobiia bacterium]|nr:hypothetical protein [Acidimicrobiia bacterium]